MIDGVIFISPLLMPFFLVGGLYLLFVTLSAFFYIVSGISI
jgi:hypothetical protein